MKFKLVFIFTFILFWKNIILAEVKDTSFFIAYEKCTDSTLYNCWLGQLASGMYEDGFIMFDGTISDLISSTNYAWYYFSPGFPEIDSIFQIETKRQFIDSVYMLTESKVSFMESTNAFYDYFTNYFTGLKINGSVIQIENARADRILSKKKMKKRIYEKGLYDFDRLAITDGISIISSTRVYYLYEIKCRIFQSAHLRERVKIVDDAKIISKLLQVVEIHNYYLLDVFSIVPYNISYDPETSSSMPENVSIKYL